jgi:hypothetical protein
MMNGSGGSGGRPPPDDEDGEGAGPFGAGGADALADAGDADLLMLGTAVLAELKDRGLLRVLLRNRTDSATAFEVDAIRESEDGLDLVAAGFHAETPEDYAGWVEESATLWHRLHRPGLSEQDAEAMLGTASDEALLLTLDSARLADAEEEDARGAIGGGVPMPPPDSAVDTIGTRVAIELLRRGVIEAQNEE